MIEVIVRVDYEGKNYETNVIVSKQSEKNEIYDKALKQVIKQLEQ
jgi:hypothetical protein